MPHTLTGLLRVVNNSTDPDFVQKIEDLIHELGADALSYIGDAQNNGMFIYYDVYLDGSVTVATTVEDFIEGLQDLDDVDAVMWVDTNNHFGKYEFTFSSDDNKLNLPLASGFLENVQDNVLEVLRELQVQYCQWKNRTDQLSDKQRKLLKLINEQFAEAGLPDIEPAMIEFTDDKVNPQFTSPFHHSNKFPNMVTVRSFEVGGGSRSGIIYYKTDTEHVVTEVQQQWY